MMVLNEALNTRENNVSAIKAAAAWLVIAGHSFAFACNYEQKDFMAMLSGDAYNLGGFAVSIFFFFSGLFIAKSLLSGKYSLKTYALRRIERIFPPFIFITALIIILCGLFITDLDAAAFFTSADTYRYMLNCVFVRVHDLPGVFTNNVYGTSVNGPIWTIKVEVLCYAACYILYRLSLLDRNKALYGALAALAGVIWLGRFDRIPAGITVLIRPVGMFFMGVLYTVYSENIQIDIKSFCFSAAGCVLLLCLGFPETAVFVMLPEVLCAAAFLFKKTPKLTALLSGIGSASYETYLWGGFIGQAVVWFFGGKMSPWVNMGFTIVIATILGMLTHMFFQKIKKGTA